MFPTEPAAVNNGFGTVLKNRAFMLLWIGQLVSQLGDKVFFVLMVALLENYPHPPGAENSMYSTLMVVFTIPAILFGSLGGVFVDRFPKKLIMVGSDVVRGLMILGIPLFPKKFAVLLIFVFIISSLTQFFAPAEQAAIPLLVKKENLLAANALFSSTMMGALIIGFAIGEPILSAAKNLLGSNYGQELVVGALYLLSAGIMQPINFREHKPISENQAVIHPWTDFKQGLRYLRKNRLVLNAMLQLTTLYCVFAALTVLTIRLAEEFGLKEKQFGFFLAAAGVGMVLGAAILGHWGEKFHHKPLPLLGFLMMALVLGLFTFTHNLLIALGLCALLGLGASLIGVPMQTLIQQQTPPNMHGKVFGFQNHAVNIALSAPLAITGPLTDALGLRTVLVGMSVVVVVVGVWAWQNTRRVLQDVI